MEGRRLRRILRRQIEKDCVRQKKDRSLKLRSLYFIWHRKYLLGNEKQLKDPFQRIFVQLGILTFVYCIRISGMVDKRGNEDHKIEYLNHVAEGTKIPNPVGAQEIMLNRSSCFRLREMEI